MNWEMMTNTTKYNGAKTDTKHDEADDEPFRSKSSMLLCFFTIFSEHIFLFFIMS